MGVCYLGSGMDVSPGNDPRSIEIPGEVVASGEDGRIYPFSVLEDRFLTALSELHDVGLASERVGKDLEWAGRFFRKPKVREWLTLKARQHASKSGTTTEWWYSYGRSVLAGKMDWWDGVCAECSCEVRTYLEPMNAKTMGCYLCNSPVLMTRHEQAVKPTREQIVVWSELGARAVPKIERVQHEFTDDTFVFKPMDEKAGS